MITHLHVKNYALIDELSIGFNAGFSSITGETGAGKSILLGAMGLALGERANLKSALDSDKKCVVELTVQLGNYGLESMFDELDLDYAEESILRREILPSGKSRAFINDTPARLGDLSAIAERLIDIHSQNDTLLLRDSKFQLALIDYFASNSSELKSFVDCYSAWKSAKQDLLAIEDELTKGQDMDYLQFLFDELEAAKLDHPDEEEEIEEELKRLQHVEEVTESLAQANGVYESEGGLSDQFEALRLALSAAARFDDRVRALKDRLESVQIELDDIQSELSGLSDGGDAEPRRLRELDDRMSTLQHLKAKHKALNLEELISIQSTLEKQLSDFANMENRIEEARSVLQRTEVALASAGKRLTTSRKNALEEIEGRIQDLLSKLNMPNAQVSLVLNAKELPDSSGYDQLEWVFTANKGQTAKPLHQVASGGELSRVMLALKAIMSASKSLPTIVFDEIDTGISGETARRVADILSNMGTQMQVLAITHLPQIAASGAYHYKVIKEESNGNTRTRIHLLDTDSRIDEISRILSGDQISEAARANAQELLSSH